MDPLEQQHPSGPSPLTHLRKRPGAENNWPFTEEWLLWPRNYRSRQLLGYIDVKEAPAEDHLLIAYRLIDEWYDLEQIRYGTVTQERLQDYLDKYPTRPGPQPPLVGEGNKFRLFRDNARDYMAERYPVLHYEADGAVLREIKPRKTIARKSDDNNYWTHNAYLAHRFEPADFQALEREVARTAAPDNLESHNPDLYLAYDFRYVQPCVRRVVHKEGAEVSFDILNKDRIALLPDYPATRVLRVEALRLIKAAERFLAGRAEQDFDEDVLLKAFPYIVTKNGGMQESPSHARAGRARRRETAHLPVLV